MTAIPVTILGSVWGRIWGVLYLIRRCLDRENNISINNDLGILIGHTLEIPHG
jgi:hypothetical protein